MKKRLRKKLHKGEFAEYGFSVSLDFVPGLTIDEIEDFHIYLDDNVLVRHGLDIGGGGSERGFEGYVTRYKSTCTEDDRNIVLAALRNAPLVSEARVGPLTDAWYP